MPPWENGYSILLPGTAAPNYCSKFLQEIYNTGAIVLA
jgi:hypothetical protein